MNNSYDGSNTKNLLKISTPSSLSSNNIINKYGVKVDDAILFRKLLQNRYKEDLDNLINIKANESQNIKNKENDEFSKIQRMNDKYNLEKINQISLFKEYNSYNEKEAEEKKQKMKELKENQHKEYLEKINAINMENEITKKINQEKKEQLRLQIEKDLIEYRQKKFKEQQKEKKESEEYILNKINNDIFLDSEKKYRSMLSKMNNNIYKNALRYNEYLHDGKNNDYINNNNSIKEIYNIKDDLQFNQKINEIKQKEKEEKMLQILNNNKIQKEKSNMQKKLEKELKEQRLLDQQKYRIFLDKQKIEHRNNSNSNKVLVSSGEQLLMPSYRYSNVPKSLIDYTLSKNYSVSNTIKKEVSPKKFYLGDSTLKHNPITFPVEDISPKKYIINQVNKQNINNNRKLSNSVDYRYNFRSVDASQNRNIFNDNNL